VKIQVLWDWCCLDCKWLPKFWKSMLPPSAG